MAGSDCAVDENYGQIHWDHVLDNLLENPSLLDSSALSSPPDSFFQSLGEMEQMLMADEDNEEDARRDKLDEEQQPVLQVSNDFCADFLLDSPAESHRSPEIVDLSNADDDDDAPKNSNLSCSSDEGQKKIITDDAYNNLDVVDAISKKRLRQLRNRDAAVRSRERKKMYVRDLEMKSRYLEGECRRLGMLLQCCFAENQALRLSLHNSKAIDTSMTKQESAVLLLESLLLGSLLWFLGIICLCILPRPGHWNLEVVPEENGEEKNQAIVCRRRTGSKICGIQVYQCFMVSKRCKASRSRMKQALLGIEA